MNRPLAFLLAASLAVNLWLGWKWAATSVVSATSPSYASAPSARASGSPNGVTRGLESLVKAPLNELSDQLRAAGVSPHLIRAILRVRFREKYRAEWDASEVPAFLPAEWWKVRIDRPEHQARQLARAELNQRIERELATLLGEQGPTRDDESRYWFLPPGKALAARRIAADYQALRAVHARDPNQLAAIEAEQNRELLQVLTPTELAEYQLRFSPEVEQLRYSATRIDATEAEFRALLDIRRKATPGWEAIKTNEEKIAREAEFQKQVYERLGGERGADFLWNGDSAYEAAKLALRTQNLPVTSAIDLINLRQAITARAFLVAANQGLPRETRLASLRELATEARAGLTGILPGFAFPLESTNWIAELERGAVMWNYTVTRGATGFGPP